MNTDQAHQNVLPTTEQFAPADVVQNFADLVGQTPIEERPRLLEVVNGSLIEAEVAVILVDTGGAEDQKRGVHSKLTHDMFLLAYNATRKAQALRRLPNHLRHPSRENI